MLLGELPRGDVCFMLTDKFSTMNTHLPRLIEGQIWIKCSCLQKSNNNKHNQLFMQLIKLQLQITILVEVKMFFKCLSRKNGPDQPTLLVSLQLVSFLVLNRIKYQAPILIGALPSVHLNVKLQIPKKLIYQQNDNVCSHWTNTKKNANANTNTNTKCKHNPTYLHQRIVTMERLRE